MNDLGDLLNRVDVGDAVLELADHPHLALDIADRNHPHIQIARLGDNTIVGAQATFNQVNRPYTAAGFSDDTGDDQIPFQRSPTTSHGFRRHENAGNTGLHVDRAQAIQIAIGNVTAKGIMLPLGLAERSPLPVARVSVAAEHEAGAAAVAA